MATIAEILPREWPGEVWTITGDDYSTLVWDAGNPTQPMPLEATIRAFSASVDAEIAAEELARRKDDELYTQGEMLSALDRIVATLEQIEANQNNNAFTPDVDLSNATGTGIVAVRNRIDQIKAIT